VDLELDVRISNQRRGSGDPGIPPQFYPCSIFLPRDAMQKVLSEPQDPQGGADLHSHSPQGPSHHRKLQVHGHGASVSRRVSV